MTRRNLLGICRPFTVADPAPATDARRVAHLVRRFALTPETAALLAGLIWAEGRE